MNKNGKALDALDNIVTAYCMSLGLNPPIPDPESQTAEQVELIKAALTHPREQQREDEGEVTALKPWEACPELEQALRNSKIEDGCLVVARKHLEIIYNAAIDQMNSLAISHARQSSGRGEATQRRHPMTPNNPTIARLEALRKTIPYPAGTEKHEIRANGEIIGFNAGLDAAIAVVGDAWEKIETAPRDGTHILVAWDHGSIEKVSWCDDWKSWQQSCDPSLKVNNRGATHWQPLPAAPRAGEE